MKKESVNKFDLEAAFKALEEIEIPVVKGIKPNRANLQERFTKKLTSEILIEDYYDVNDQNDLEAAQEEREAEIAKAKLARIEKIVDLDAESEEDLLPSYVGKVIIQCPQCMTLFYKNQEDIATSEENPEVVNINEICQHCGNSSGYTLIGKVDKVGEDEAENYDVEDFDENELNLDFEDVEEPSEEEFVEDNVEDVTAEEGNEEELELEPVDETEEENSEEEEEEVKESLTLNEEIEDEISEVEETPAEEILTSVKEVKEVAEEAAEAVLEASEEETLEDIKEVTDEVVENHFEVKDEIEDEVSEEEVVEESLLEAVDKELDAKLKAHNEYIEYLKDMIEKEEKSLANAKNDFVKKSIQSRIDALKADLEAALPEALKGEIETDLPTAEEIDLEATENTEEKEETKESLTENLTEDVKIIGDLSDYSPWSGAVDTWNKIQDAGLVDDLDTYLEECYPDGLTMTELNDILWFESEEILNYLGIGEEEVEESLTEDEEVGLKQEAEDRPNYSYKIKYSYRYTDEQAKDDKPRVGIKTVTMPSYEEAEDFVYKTLSINAKRPHEFIVLEVNDEKYDSYIKKLKKGNKSAKNLDENLLNISSEEKVVIYCNYWHNETTDVWISKEGKVNEDLDGNDRFTNNPKEAAIFKNKKEAIKWLASDIADGINDYDIRPASSLPSANLTEATTTNPRVRYQSRREIFSRELAAHPAFEGISTRDLERYIIDLYLEDDPEAELDVDQVIEYVEDLGWGKIILDNIDNLSESQIKHFAQKDPIFVSTVKEFLGDWLLPNKNYSTGALVSELLVFLDKKPAGKEEAKDFKFDPNDASYKEFKDELANAYYEAKKVVPVGEALVGDVNINLDARGQSVGIAGGTGGEVHNDMTESFEERCKKVEQKGFVEVKVELNPAEANKCEMIIKDDSGKKHYFTTPERATDLERAYSRYSRSKSSEQLDEFIGPAVASIAGASVINNVVDNVFSEDVEDTTKVRRGSKVEYLAMELAKQDFFKGISVQIIQRILIPAYIEDFGRDNLTAEEVTKYFSDYGFGGFVLDNYFDLSLQHIKTLGKHDPKFVETLRKYCEKYNMTPDEADYEKGKFNEFEELFDLSIGTVFESNSELETIEELQEIYKELTPVTESLQESGDLDTLLDSEEFKKPISDAEVEKILAKYESLKEDVEPGIESELAIQDIVDTWESVEEIDEESLDKLTENYLTEVYSNVKSFKTTDCALEENKLVVEGKITFNSGKEKNTKFVFEAKKENNKIILEGLNADFATEKAFVLNCNLDTANRLIVESLSYKYTINNILVEGLTK